MSPNVKSPVVPYVVNKSSRLILFLALAALQIGVPASWIFISEKVLEEGQVYKFKCAPVDPNDPFRGKYITLGFESSTFYSEKAKEWVKGENAYVILKTDDLGFASVKDIMKSPPLPEEPHFLCTVSYVDTVDNFLMLNLPFERYYLEEGRAPEAERLYQESMRDSTMITYALVSVLAGEARIQDVVINGVPLSR